MFLERGKVSPPNELTVAVSIKSGIVNLYKWKFLTTSYWRKKKGTESIKRYSEDHLLKEERDKRVLKEE